MDIERNADFTKYQTLSFLGWQENINELHNDFDQESIQKALKAEMDKRNHKIIEENGDMIVSIYLLVDLITSITAYTDYYGGVGYGNRHGC